MGKYLNKFKESKQKINQGANNSINKIQHYANKNINQKHGFEFGRLKQNKQKDMGENLDGFEEDFFEEDYSPYDVGIQIAQKPASFHHFILENRYNELEKSIRGYKDVHNKDTDKWEIKRKKNHCFTDEEAENIIRTAQSHLATDIKLTFYNKESFGTRILAIYESLETLFKRITEYRFGRFGEAKHQGEMKEQAWKIFIELITRIEANYLRAVGGMENKLTHLSVRSQESLQGDNEEVINRRYT